MPLRLREELEIDVGSIIAKARCIVLPTAANRAYLQQNLQESADFWGPVSLATAYSLLIVWGQFKVIPWVISVWLAWHIASHADVWDGSAAAQSPTTITSALARP